MTSKTRGLILELRLTRRCEPMGRSHRSQWVSDPGGPGGDVVLDSHGTFGIPGPSRGWSVKDDSDRDPTHSSSPLWGPGESLPSGGWNSCHPHPGPETPPPSRDPSSGPLCPTRCGTPHVPPSMASRVESSCPSGPLRPRGRVGTPQSSTKTKFD